MPLGIYWGIWRRRWSVWIVAGPGVYQNLLILLCFSAPYSLLHVYLYSKFERFLLLFWRAPVIKILSCLASRRCCFREYCKSGVYSKSGAEHADILHEYNVYAEILEVAT